MVQLLKTAALAATMLGAVMAHPGEVRDVAKDKREAALSKHLAARGADKLARCLDTPKARSIKERAVARRAAKYQALKEKRGVAHKRSVAEIEYYDALNHNYTGEMSSGSGLTELFDANTSCILQPEEIIGPYWIEGEFLRENVVEDQDGVAQAMEMQFIDVNTCEPVSGLYIDIWAANATGVYSGLTDSGLNTTFLRGIQVTDDEGVADFDAIVPGHYSNRATHFHVLVHQDVTVYPNGTYGSGTARAIGQLYYDTELRAAVEANYPYTTNTVAATANDEDTVLPEVDLGDFDPFYKYAYLSDDIADGLFTWHSIGIDMTANYTADASAYGHLYASGGVANSNGGGSGYGGPPPS
ncbi:Intradiol ring-cleavage dioxygenase [Xylariaceae sp. FL0804]|nr:Intradiol ring-cleavage dioxygenase [Xylariaceae sp. FL0804]